MIASTSLDGAKKPTQPGCRREPDPQRPDKSSGPTLGAFFVALMPLQGILFIDVFTAILAVVPLLFFKIPQPTRKPTDAEAREKNQVHSVWQDLAEGWRYVKGWPALWVSSFWP